MQVQWLNKHTEHHLTSSGDTHTYNPSDMQKEICVENSGTSGAGLHKPYREYWLCKQTFLQGYNRQQGGERTTEKIDRMIENLKKV